MKFTGLGANAGQVTGPVCIVHSTNEFDHCTAEHIAVLVGVKPNAALASRVKGLAAIHGGVTSHAAIAARENNKPAVVGLAPEFLESISEGQMVMLNGDEGVVEIV